MCGGCKGKKCIGEESLFDVTFFSDSNWKSRKYTTLKEIRHCLSEGFEVWLMCGSKKLSKMVAILPRGRSETVKIADLYLTPFHLMRLGPKAAWHEAGKFIDKGFGQKAGVMQVFDIVMENCDAVRPGSDIHEIRVSKGKEPCKKTK